MGCPDVVRGGERMGRRASAAATGTPGPSGPLQIVALPPCRICGVPAGCHQPRQDQDGNVERFCPEPLPVDTGGPADWLPSEGTLLRLLKRHYGWLQPEAGQLLRARK